MRNRQSLETTPENAHSVAPSCPLRYRMMEAIIFHERTACRLHKGCAKRAISREKDGFQAIFGCRSEKSLRKFHTVALGSLATFSAEECVVVGAYRRIQTIIRPIDTLPPSSRQ